MSTIHKSVSEYYGKSLKKTSDLSTNCCTTSSAPSPHIQKLLANILPSVCNKYYGCGLIAPALLSGLRILDLGCGSGRDCYLLAQLVVLLIFHNLYELLKKL